MEIPRPKTAAEANTPHPDLFLPADGKTSAGAPRTMRGRRRARFWIENILFKAALRCIPRLPRCVVVVLADGMGLAAWLVDRRDRRIAMANLDLAYGDTLSGAEKRAIARRVFRNFSLTMTDYFWFSRNTRERVRRYVEVDELSERWLKGGPLVAVTAHFGNWEVFGHAAMMQGSMLASVAKPVKNPEIDRRINALREASGQRIVPRAGALKALVRVLRDRGTVALLLDQDTRVEDGGVFVPFFGVPVPVSGAAAGLAVRMEVPLVMAYCAHRGGGFYRCYVRDVLRPEELRGKDPGEVTARVSAMLEEEIRRDPAQWLWTYKRWKRRMPGVPAERYPFYADC